MKKKIFSMLVLLMTAVSGAWAQYESHWPDFNGYDYNEQGVLVAAIQIDGVTITSEYEGWDALEIAYFVGDECRGNGNCLYNGYVVEYGDPFPTIDGDPIFYNNAGEQVSFKMYDHINGILYEDCVVTYNGEPLTILTGDDHFEGWDDPDNPVFLNFTSPEPAEPETPAVPVTSVAKNEWEFTMPDYAVVAKIEYDTELALDEVDDNTAKLEDWDGYEADVTLTRTLQAGSWNTFAAPFSTTIPEGWTVKELSSTSFADGTLTLNFANAANIEAGKPYLVKVSANADLSAAPFTGAIVSKDAQPFTSTDVDFIPTLGATTIPDGDTKAVLFLAAGNKLLNPSALPADMKGFRAYFQLKGEAASLARAFSIDFGDGKATGITSIGQLDNLQSDDWYDLSGRKLSNGQLSNRQMKKGVYIQNSKKVIIK